MGYENGVNAERGKIPFEAKTEKAETITPNFLQSVRLKYVKLGYYYLISKLRYLFLIPLLGVVSVQLFSITVQNFVQLWHHFRYNLVVMIFCSSVMVFLGTFYFMTRPRKVYVVDFACFKPGPELTCSRERYINVARQYEKFNEEELAFQKKILEKSGYGDKTAYPEAFFRVRPGPCMADAKEEAEMVMFCTIDQLLAKTGVSAKEIGILLVNGGLFCPSPSLSAMIVNHYKLRSNILSYNLGGMGCSAGIISIDLSKELLQVYPNSYSLVVSFENMSLNCYFGSNRSMLLTNCIFRLGGAAILLSNKSCDLGRSKYELIHTVRTHKGADDKSYNCVFQQEDEKGIRGVALSKDLMAVAGEALKMSITALGPLVLPMSEQFLFLGNSLARKFFYMKIKPYIPDFKLAFEHFFVHPGGRAVLDEIEKNLKLTEWHMEPSRMTLYRYGNTSSSSLWYELAYAEAKGRIRKGDRMCQIAFGSGFKCNCAAWRALRTIDPAIEKNPWTDEIDQFPVHVPQVATIPL